MKNIIKYGYKLTTNRRDFLKNLAIGSAGMVFGSGGLSGCAVNMKTAAVEKKLSLQKPLLDMEESRVSLVTGRDRREMVFEALKPFEQEIKDGIHGKKVFIKPNIVCQGNPYMVAHPDAVRGILDFIKPFHNRQVLIGESTSTAAPIGTAAMYDQYGYLDLTKEYNIQLVELNDQPTTYEWILDRNMYPHQIHIISEFLDPNNFIISLTRLKTHNCVVATLSLKNVVMGSPLKNPRTNVCDKHKVHAEHPDKKYDPPKMINFNIFLLAHKIHPDFSILDGFEGAEGNGPVYGEPVEHRVVVAGPDFVSVDRIGSELMGIPWEDIGYLQYCHLGGLGQGDRNRIKVIGENPGDHIIKYKLNDNIEWQYTWKDDVMFKMIK